MKTLLEIFAPMLHGIDSYLARPKYHLTIKKPGMYHFHDLPDFGGLTARLIRLMSY